KADRNIDIECAYLIPFRFGLTARHNFETARWLLIMKTIRVEHCYGRDRAANSQNTVAAGHAGGKARGLRWGRRTLSRHGLRLRLCRAGRRAPGGRRRAGGFLDGLARDEQAL